MQLNRIKLIFWTVPSLIICELTGSPYVSICLIFPKTKVTKCEKRVSTYFAIYDFYWSVSSSAYISWLCSFPQCTISECWVRFHFSSAWSSRCCASVGRWCSSHNSPKHNLRKNLKYFCIPGGEIASHSCPLRRAWDPVVLIWTD